MPDGGANAWVPGLLESKSGRSRDGSECKLATQAARVIVCEKTGSWATALRNLLPSAQISLCETRTLEECAARLRESPASLVVVELTAENCPGVCRWLTRQAEQFVGMRAVAVVTGDMRDADAVVRSAGAHHVVDSMARLEKLTRWIVRHIQQAPHSKSSVRQWTWSRMPWPPRGRARQEQ